jgi:hypothetical protein
VTNLPAQFLLGMAIALIGQPSETTGAAHAASNVLLGLHASSIARSGVLQARCERPIE